MRTFLLTWNPAKWAWQSLETELRHFREEGSLDDTWSCGSRKDLPLGSRVYLMKLGEEPKGLVASGVVKVEPHRNPHWEEEKARKGKKALFVKVRFDVLEREPILGLDELSDEPFPDFDWTPRSSGIEIPPEVARVLGDIWVDRVEAAFAAVYPDEVQEGLIEGSAKRVSVNAYERSAEARRNCIRKYGAVCQVCGIDFGERYGEVARGFIHVHHLKPLSEIKAGYVVNPKEDLVPVCPNCHAVIHRRKPPFGIDEVKQLLDREPG